MFEKSCNYKDKEGARCNSCESLERIAMLWVRLFSGGRVPAYRLYRLDGAGKIATADWIDADDDHDARTQARERADGSHFEVWQRNRLVARTPELPEQQRD